VIKNFDMDDDDIADDAPFGGEESEDSVEEINRRKDERAVILGFYPQKELIYNTLLPYTDQLDAESKIIWGELKSNIGKAICLRELRPGYVVWSGRLAK
jgi:hypothetical protein